jgi:uncharacterized membrane protein HdeD (DUF308 family)
MSTDIVLPMIGLFTKNWWVLLLRGIVAVLFGILAITSPGITLAVLVLLFGIYAVVDGCFEGRQRASGMANWIWWPAVSQGR